MDTVDKNKPALAEASNVPLWFKPEIFVDPSFAPEGFVQDLQRFVPLEAIKDELTKHLEALQHRLVEVVNDDYMNFVDLSTNLVDVDASISRMQRPVLDVKEQVEGARAAVAAKAAQLQDGLARRQAAAANRALLELAQDAAHVVSKVEKLLGELPKNTEANGAAGGAEDIDALEARCRLLDRICSEVSRLNFYLAKGKGLPLMKQIQPRAESSAAKVQSALDSALRSTLKAQNPAALGVLIHAYASVNRPHAAEAIVKEEVIQPMVNAAVTGLGVSPTLEALLKTLLKALKEEAGGFLEFAMSPAAGAQAFDFLGGSILPAVVSSIETTTPGAFSPGVPDAFCKNYKVAAQFMDKLEEFAVTAEQVQRLRSCAAYKTYFGKWNLAAYFSLRFRDIAGNVEDQLTTAGLSPSPSSTVTTATAAAPDAPTFTYAATAATWSALQQCISENIFLSPLSDRFLRVSLQLLARYATWLKEGLEKASTISANDGADGNSGNNVPTPPASSTTTPERSSDSGDTAQVNWAKGATVEQLTALWRDCDALITAVNDRYLPGFISAAGNQDGSVSEAAEAVNAGFSEAGNAVVASGELALQCASGEMAEKCCNALKQLRGIVATFRMANRSAPTRPSHYVVTILAPLQQFITSTGLPAATNKEFVTAVAGGVAQRYQLLAEDTLNTVRKTEDSLRRLKYRKTAAPEAGGAEGEAAAAVLDTDKLIAMQLFLDVQEFGRQLKKLDVDAGSLPPYVSLWKAVAPEDQGDTIVF